jgi:hypothetical protein
MAPLLAQGGGIGAPLERDAVAATSSPRRAFTSVLLPAPERPISTAVDAHDARSRGGLMAEPCELGGAV